MPTVLVNTWHDLTGRDVPELRPALIAAGLLCSCQSPARIAAGGECNDCQGDPAARYDPEGNEDHFQFALQTFRRRILRVRLRASALPGP